jgi:hypothetical protein
VRYVETILRLPVGGFINYPPREILAALRPAVPPCLEVRFFAGILRTDLTGPM